MHTHLQVGSEVSADDELPEFPERAAPLEGVASRLGRVHISLEQAEGSHLQQRVPDGVLHRVGTLQSSSRDVFSRFYSYNSIRTTIAERPIIYRP